MDEGASSPGPPRPPNRARHEQELELLAEREEDCCTDKLTLIRICMEGQEGLIRGYCQHDYRPITEYIQFFPRSLRMLEFRTKAKVLLHRF